MVKATITFLAFTYLIVHDRRDDGEMMAAFRLIAT